MNATERKTRILQHTKSEIKPLKESVPTINTTTLAMTGAPMLSPSQFAEGEERWVFAKNGTLYKYIRHRGQLFYITYTKAPT